MVLIRLPVSDHSPNDILPLCLMSSHKETEVVQFSYKKPGNDVLLFLLHFDSADFSIVKLLLFSL